MMRVNKIKPMEEVKFSEIKMVRQARYTDWLCETKTVKTPDIEMTLQDVVTGSEIVYGETVDLTADDCSGIWLIIRKENEKRRYYYLIQFEAWTEETTGIYDGSIDLFHPLQVWGACLGRIDFCNIDYSADIIPSPIFKGQTLTRESYLEQCQKNRVELYQEIQERNKQTSS